MAVAVPPPTIVAAPVIPTGQSDAPVPVRKANPSKVRLAVLMFVAVYPLITAILYVVMPLTATWATWERTLVIAPLMVVSIVFVIAPRVQRHFGWFIARMPRPHG